MTNNPSDALRCPDCEEAARHAYSDATTPGFFNPKCPKHQADVLRAAIRKACEQIANELGAAEMLSGPCMDAARIIERHLSPVVLAAEAAAIEDEAQNPWKRVIIEELIVDHTLMKEHVNNPKKALGEIIRWNQKVALDPAVSEDACKLQAQARLEEHKRVCRTCVNSLTSLCARGRELEAQANP